VHVLTSTSFLPHLRPRSRYLCLPRRRREWRTEGSSDGRTDGRTSGQTDKRTDRPTDGGQWVVHGRSGREKRGRWQRFHSVCALLINVIKKSKWAAPKMAVRGVDGPIFPRKFRAIACNSGRESIKTRTYNGFNYPSV